MIIVRLCGGLGNQMFQYAAGLALAKNTGQELKLDITGYDAQVQGDTPRAYRLQFFHIAASVASADEVRKYKYPSGIISKAERFFKKKFLRKFYMDYHPEIIANPPSYLDGFFQSEKYFLAYREVILSAFTLKTQYLSSEVVSWKNKIESAGGNSISLHVRRGDYFANSVTTKIHGVDLSDYYKNAVALINQKVTGPHFFIFSDDIAWVKENLALDGQKTYVSSPTLQDYQELAVMSFCRHNIIANSSFSWWGAWLNRNPEKIVVAPAQWTVTNTDHPNIIPESWIKL